MYNEPAVRDPAHLERILVVDDEEYIRDLICTILGAAGYQCTSVASGNAALGLLASEAFELMLSDMRMSEMDGTVLLDRAKEKYPDMPVIMVTAVNDTSEAVSTLRNGAFDYLLKPFERDELLTRVRQALENRRLKLENRDLMLHLEARVEEQTALLRQMNADLERAMSELEHSYDMTLEALGSALDFRDGETEHHSRRVTAFTIEIARAMGIRGELLRVIARGAFLHDIGKMAVRDELLRRPGPLTADEKLEMQKHCELGYQMVRKIPFLADAVADIVYSHQERWDGTGYPRGLKGEEIPLGARIFAIADTLDAMTSNRPYRAALSYQAAREEIIRWSGRQFDPRIVQIFLGIPEHLWQRLRQELSDENRPPVYKALEGSTPAVHQLASSQTN